MQQRYETVPLSKLKPDPNQPRKYFDEEALKGMTISIKNEGLINAIEVDEDYVIVTGERRWRASRAAGLKEVPVKVLVGLKESQRFIRQVQENIHQNTMSAWDTAEALDKVRKSVTSSAAELDRDAKHQSERYLKGVAELSKIFGLPKSTVSSYLSLLEEKGEMKKALQTPGFQRTKLDTIKETPKEYQEKLKKVVASQKTLTRDTVRHMATAIRRAARYDEKEKIEKLLQENYEGLSTLEALSKINKIIPTEESRVKEPADALRMISEKMIEFMDLMEKHPLESFDDFHRPMIANDIRRFGMFLAGYLGIKNNEVKKIKEENGK